MGAEQGTLVIFQAVTPKQLKHLNLFMRVLSQRVTRMGETGTGTSHQDLQSIDCCSK